MSEEQIIEQHEAGYAVIVTDGDKYRVWLEPGTYRVTVNAVGIRTIKVQP